MFEELRDHYGQSLFKGKRGTRWGKLEKGHISQGLVDYKDILFFLNPKCSGLPLGSLYAGMPLD